MGEEEVDVGVYPIYFGVSCAFAAVEALGGKWSPAMEMMLQGSAELLGLLVWKAQRVEKVRKAELEVSELRRKRSEDGKASEKVVSMFAEQEQRWVSEKKRLRLRIQALASELRLVGAKNKQLVASLEERIKEKEDELRIAELEVENVREAMKKDAQEHVAEIWKHKTAFMELVSNQRRLESEVGRAIREAQAANKQLVEVVEGKRESDAVVKKVSEELAQSRKEGEQKDRVLSAMLRKAKFNSSEKHVLMKEGSISKFRRKQAELEMKKWKGEHCDDAKNGKVLKGFCGDGESFFNAGKSMEGSGSSSCGDGQFSQGSGLTARALVIGERKESGSNILRVSRDGLLEENAEIKEFEAWVRKKAEKYTSSIEKRHCEEIDAFAEQMRVKDEKLEACRWQMMSMELESKRLESHMTEVDQNLSHIKEENAKLDALLLGKEQELKSLQENFSLHLQVCRKGISKQGVKFQFVDPVALWSEVKIVRKKPKEKVEVEAKTEIGQVNKGRGTRCNQRGHPDESTVVEVCQESMKKHRNAEKSYEIEPAEEVSSSQVPEQEIEEEKEIILEPCHAQGGSPSSSQEESEIDLKLTSENNSVTKRYSPRKMDLHALGISYKIKRLQQQLSLLEKTSGCHAFKKPTIEDRKANDRIKIDGQLEHQMKEFFQIISFLMRQVRRYQTLEERVDGLCLKMETSRDGKNAQPKKENETLTQFLEETFQLQRYMVATGQKLMEIQCKVSSRGFLGGFEGIEEYEGFNMQQFADNIRKLFGDVQRGLEIRISRIIGGLEGTLASEGILHLRG